jgi:hypothetical protein
MNQIQYVRLNTGHDLVATVTVNHNERKNIHTLMLKKPAIIQIVQNEQGQIGPVLHPWVLFAKNDYVVVDIAHVLFYTDPVPELTRMYQEATGAIVIAPANALPSGTGKLELVKG